MKRIETVTCLYVQSWNTGATMEQFDYSEWMKKRVEALLLGVSFKNSSLRITEVVKVEGSATILLIRGKYRPGYDISFECKYGGILEPGHLEEVEAAKKSKGDSDDDDEADKERKKKQCQGTLKMHDITSEDDPDDWEYEVSIKKLSARISVPVSILRIVHDLTFFDLVSFRKSKRNKAAMQRVKEGRDDVVELIGVFVKELKLKKC